MGKHPDKDIMELFHEFGVNGYVEHICPDCGDTCLPTEVDNTIAHCENCQEKKTFKPVI